jgi:hypothetical protein
MPCRNVLAMFGFILLLTSSTWADHTEKGSSNYGYFDPSFSDCQNGHAPFQNGQNSCVAFRKHVLNIKGTVMKAAAFTYHDWQDGSTDTYEVFKLPIAIEAGTRVRMTFRSLNEYGGFYCANGSATFGVDYTDHPDPTPLVGLPCTQGDVPQNPDAHFTETDSGNTATFTFNATAESMLNWTFYTTPGNLIGFEVISGSGSASRVGPNDPEARELMLGRSLIWRRRTLMASAA